MKGYNNMIFALIVFILTYVLMIALPKYRLITVIVSALIFLVFGVLPIKEVFNDKFEEL